MTKATRKPYDFYATPETTTEALVSALHPNKVQALQQFHEPCRGDGAIIRVFSRVLGIPEACWTWNEIRDDSDYLTSAIHPTTQAIITNPPFTQAQEFLDKSLRENVPFIAYLLRINFLGSQKRHDWWQGKEPTHMLALSKRPSFTGKGTDSTEYAWFIWDQMGLLRKDQTLQVVM